MQSRSLSKPELSPVELVPREVEMAELLVHTYPQYISSEAIAERTGISYDDVRHYIYQLRRKGIWVRNRRGYGYRLSPSHL